MHSVRFAFMPGAISRTTGSAIRWNSFQPFFIRHCSVKPFNAATGVHGWRPGDEKTFKVLPYSGPLSRPIWWLAGIETSTVPHCHLSGFPAYPSVNSLCL